MTLDDDLHAVRGRLGPANPVPDPTLSPYELANGRSSLGQRPLPAEAMSASSAKPKRRGPLVAVAVGAVAALVVSLVLALPGGKTRPATPIGQTSALLAAYTVTQQAQTARASFSVQASGTSITGSGVGNLTSGEGSGVVNLPAPFGQVNFVSTGQVVYAEVPATFRSFTGGKPWAKLATGNLGAIENQFLGGAGVNQPFDPTNILAYLKAVSGNVIVVGPDTVRGTATTHYRATIDLSRVAPGQQGTVPADVWIDGQGRLRKLTMSMAAPMAATATFELSDFGTHVDATPPPAGQVADASSILGKLFGGTHP
jgi:hypothetical protein